MEKWYENAEPEKTPIEMRKNIVEQQSEMYGSALERIMERSDNDPDLVTAMRDFIKAIEIKSHRGQSDEPLSKGYVEMLTTFFQEKAEELRQF